MQLVRSFLTLAMRAVRRLWPIALPVALAILLILTAAPRGVAVEFTPPDRNAPGRILIEGGGARFADGLPDRGAPDSAGAGGARFADFEIGVDGVRILEIPGRECPLTAALPASTSGLTLRPYPSIFVHMPPYPDEPVEFRLMTEDDVLVYATQYVPNPIDGTYDITLPDSSNLPPLEVGVMYRWTFAIPSEELVLSGGIVRGEPTADFAADLAAASPIERVELLAETGIWYDAVAEAADLVRSDRDRADYKALWDGLMYSVDLDKMAMKPLL